MTVENMRSPRTGAKVVNQFVITDGCRTVFQSYDSTIAEIDLNTRTITIHEDWNYSATTGKYRNAFFDDMGFGELASKQGLNKAMEKCCCTSDFGVEYKVIFEA